MLDTAPSLSLSLSPSQLVLSLVALGEGIVLLLLHRRIIGWRRRGRRLGSARRYQLAPPRDSLPAELVARHSLRYFHRPGLLLAPLSQVILMLLSLWVWILRNYSVWWFMCEVVDWFWFCFIICLVVEKAKWLNSEKINSISKQMIDIDVRKNVMRPHPTLPIKCLS